MAVNLSTPEGYISDIQSGRIQALPTYQEHDDSPANSRPLISTIDPNDTRHIPPTYSEIQDPASSWVDLTPSPIQENETDTSKLVSQDREPVAPEDPESINIQAEIERQCVIRGFFDAIAAEQIDATALFLDRELVTANTSTSEGLTPLLAAVATKNQRIVQLLLDSGAVPDAYGVTVRADLKNFAEFVWPRLRAALNPSSVASYVCFLG